MMTLFAIFRSPLMFGGDLPGNDAFTLSLLTNNEVLDVSKYSSNNHQLYRENDLVVWAADDTKTGDKYVAFFNAQDQNSFVENRASWTSSILSAKSGKVDTVVKLDITGARKLYLVVSDGGDGTGWDHADWIDPVISGKNGSIKLTSLEWVSATSGWGEAVKNRSVGGNPMNVNGEVYTDGIGTHANSVIEFDLPEGYSTFSSKVGLDKDCVEHKEGSSVKFLVYTQDPSGEKIEESTKIPVTLKQLGLKGSYAVRDLWSHKELGVITDEFAPVINNHGAGLYRISKVK